MQGAYMKDLGVLVVHDDEEVLSVIKRLFSYIKIRVDCVGSTLEALDRLNTKNYRTLITDMDMPGVMNGIELTLKARGLFPKLKVILFSGHSTEQIINLIIDPKVSDITEKDLKPITLNEVFRNIMNDETGRIYLLE
jgi:CheY-like chemotaxis protein